MEINDITWNIIDASIKIHKTIGPDCFERVYEELLYYELTKRGSLVKRQLLFSITYEELRIENAYKLDLLVEKK